MLWEATDSHAALRQRFRFASGAETRDWLVTTLYGLYGIQVTGVTRLVISSYNLLAWLTTTDGLLLAKCCASLQSHERLANVADVLTWLDQQQLPVSVPLLAQTGERQVRAAHLSLGVQRVIPGELLEPTQPAQTHAAGVMLAQLHRALAAYPRTTAFAPPTAQPALAEAIAAWAAKQATSPRNQSLMAGVELLQQLLASGTLPDLTSQLVHQDYRAANILWNEGNIAAVLDFEELRWGYRLNDLAWAAVHLGTRYHHWGPVSDAVHATFLAAYASQQSLTATEQGWLPVLMLWHSINLAGSAAGGENFDAAVASVVTYTRRLAAQQAYAAR